jgi:mRNA interferase MazF
VRRGEIYLVDLGPGVGREASGLHPVVVMSDDVYLTNPLAVVVVPAVDAANINAAVGVLVTAAESGLSSDISVLARQPRTLDPSRFPEHPAGIVPDKPLQLIADKLKGELDL